jgi:hypothetical protein
VHFFGSGQDPMADSFKHSKESLGNTAFWNLLIRRPLLSPSGGACAPSSSFINTVICVK